jgi:hypothetical protein
MNVRITIALALAGTLLAVSHVRAAIVAGTSFEEPGVLPGVQYVDTLDPLTDHALLDNADEPWVNYPASGDELGFFSWYYNTRDDVGLSDGDFVGVTDWTGDVDAYTDGVQGFEISDADGLMRTTLDAVALNPGLSPEVALDLFVVETGWEADDYLRVWLEVDGGAEIDLLNTSGQDIDDLGIEDSWMTLSADLSGYSTATLMFELDSNAASEAIYVDHVRFSEIPAPGAMMLLALAGLTARRRR